MENLVTIVRNGELLNINEGNLRKNDIVVLQTGDIVPADLKLVEGKGLEIDEFEITGEIMPVVKTAQRSDVVIYMGSRVIKGTGKGIVFAVGEQTEYGKILKQSVEENKVDRVRLIKKKYFILIALLLPAYLMSIFRVHSYFTVCAFYFLLSAIIILLQNNELFWHLLVKYEIENYKNFNIKICDTSVFKYLNKIDIICFDKTGVLTTSQMDVTDVYFGSIAFNADSMRNKDAIFNLIIMACALCNDVYYFEKIGKANPVDKALISFAIKNGTNFKKALSQYKRIYDKPFKPEDRYMACGFEVNHKEVYYFVKGDPDVVIDMCNSYITDTGIEKKIDFEFWLSIKSNIEHIGKNGDTMIALAYASGKNNVPKEYTLLCLLQLGNKLQIGARKVVGQVTEKGIRCIMLTGDRVETAVKVSQECGITKHPNIYLAGRTIERMDFSEVARQSAYCSVFARLLPSQKGIIINLLREKGHCVAMVGDGPNDGIALKVADIGISFIENSSPVARRFSKILINDLNDILRLIEGANRIKRRAMYLELIRIILLVLLLFGLYFRTISSLNIL